MVFGIFGLEFIKKFPPHGRVGGGKNHVFVYILFGSFLEVLDIDEFNKILGHCASRNDKCFSPSRNIDFIEVKYLHSHFFELFRVGQNII